MRPNLALATVAGYLDTFGEIRMRYLPGLFGLFAALCGPCGAAPFAFITNHKSGTMSIIDTATNTIAATRIVGSFPVGVAVDPSGRQVFIANFILGSINVFDAMTFGSTGQVLTSFFQWGVAVNPAGTRAYAEGVVIDTATNAWIVYDPRIGCFIGNNWGVAVNPSGTRVYFACGSFLTVLDAVSNTVIAPISGVGPSARGIAVHPLGSYAYVTNTDAATVSVVDLTINSVVGAIPVGSSPIGIAFSPSGAEAYVTNTGSGTVSVIDTTTNTVAAMIPVGNQPYGVAFLPTGDRAYVANFGSDNVSVIDTATRAVVATIPVGSGPLAFGQFIVPAPLPPLPPAAAVSVPTLSHYGLVLVGLLLLLVPTLQRVRSRRKHTSH